MDRKKIITIATLCILVVGIIVLSVWVKKQPSKEQEAFVNKFAQDMQAAKTRTTTGTVDSIDADKMTVRLGKEYTIVKINKSTPVSIIDKTEKATKGQIADVKAGDTIKVEYDKETMVAILITKVKL